MNGTGDEPEDRADAPAADGDDDAFAADETSDAAAAAAAHRDELDGVRIRQLAAVRRGAFRARSYALVVTAGCIVVAIQLLFMTVEAARGGGWGLMTTGYVLFAVALLLVAAHFGRRVRELSEELNAPAPLPPEPPGGPDFSTLSDGSQQWKNLEDIR